MDAILRLPYEDEESGLLERVYEKDVEFAEPPVAGGLSPPIRAVGDAKGRLIERVAYPETGGCVVWLAPITGFSQLAFRRKNALDQALLAGGWRRVQHRSPPA